MPRIIHTAITPPTDVTVDQVRQLVGRINEENRRFVEASHNKGWTTDGITLAKALSSSSTLPDVINVLGTLLQHFLDRGDIQA